MTEIRVRIDAHKVTEEFKEARRDINRRTREGLKKAGELAVLPEVRERAPSIVRPWLTVRATGRRGYVTVQGERKRDRITGLLNFGGRVTTPIKPVSKQALTIGNTGEVRAAVTGPRTYKGSHFIEEGVEAGLPEMERVMLHELMKSFDGVEHTP